MKISRETFRDIRDTIGWGTVLVWAGISIQDMKFKSKAEAKPPGVTREVDLQNNEKLSKEENHDAQRAWEEFEKQKALRVENEN